ncbi:ThiF family adenylyltransferase [Vibrio splendidus]|uniref:ThiF family adenylyltransferase n=1 Tax=Vibrio splendidus TaxID=29497 RepID=UPI002469BA95|nr:ThiF family adenylyltransferase [Vibrio splendidus]MDH5935627.1 ThiF family adenylyltransferase [Vibrio splendidus]
MGKLHLAATEFLAHGYIFHPKFGGDDYCFSKSFSKASGIYNIKFEITEDSFNRPPFPIVESLPEQLRSRRLPHLLLGKYCCLFSDTSIIDPININQLVASWLYKVEEVVDLWDSGDYSEDYVAEFGVYWGGIPTYLLESADLNKNLEVYSFERRALNGNSSTEYIVASERKIAEKWAQSRNAVGVTEYRNSAVFVKLTQAPYIHYDHPWPPKSLKDFSNWLLMSSNEPVVLERLLVALAKLGKWSKDWNTFVDVIFHYDNEFFGVSFNLPTESRKAIVNHYGPKSRRGRGKHARERLRKRIFDNSREKIFPLDVMPCSPDYVIERNRAISSPILSNKRIALIGAGTIGGYLAHSLCQVGAGHDAGYFVIYDNDTLKVGNLGRHILGAKFIGERKSDSLKYHIEEQGLDLEVQAEGKFHLSSELSRFDLILDATGDQAFALNLSSKVAEYRSQGGKILLIHSWISGFGHTVKSMLDDGVNGCYACQFDYSKGAVKTELYPSFANGKEPDVDNIFKRSCGENHLPFGSEASMLAASLAVQLLRSRNKKTPSLLMRRVSDQAIELKNKKLKKNPDCPSCRR